MSTSNATSINTAVALAAANKGTFTSLVITKQGTLVGGVLYGDDTVCTVIVSGFRYERLVQRSLDKLNGLTADDLAVTINNLSGMDGRGKAALARPVTVADAEAARDELAASFAATLAGTNESTTDHVYDPLVVDGERVRGSKVYKCVAGDPEHDCRCRNCTGDARAPVPGQINLSGLAIGTVVLTPAVNGPAPAPKSGAKTVAKDALRRLLPISRYVSYRLDPTDNGWILKAGGSAARQAKSAGVAVKDSAMEALAATV